MASPTSPFMDHAAPILSGDPTLDDNARASLWDAFHSKSPDELVQHLAPLDIPNETKHALYVAKQASMPVASPTDKVTDAVKKIASLDPQVRQIAESSPNLLKAFTSAATVPDKQVQETPGATSGPSKGKKAPAASKVPLAPRIDGQPHFPEIPEGHHRVLASDGSVHDIPVESIEKARTIDPLLHVLNP